ncbi:9830_t:CDS:10 [Entrophospora sp. SA101]|nr:5017_t:CDS:10 [Entrophospora sp. SA101]CAJ0755863.1 9830_t:CDS:10 [Entrophospora sp. SA101]CAJ0850311.1 13732_t:CDS:10 [Entrophospora sp. SA101]
MPVITTSQLVKLQSKQENIRNLCILAHVDHGKTTLSDSLLSSNGIISNKLAGKVRYLDSREDEQERGITMEASGISLYFNVLRETKEGEELLKKPDEYLINLIDAPGHVDFSSEVSTASRLCDGALILVDVVEGVCTQTHTVLRQVWVENVRSVLVLNKIDRLITELKLTPMEAYTHLNKILEQVNAIMGTLFAGDIMEKETRRHEAEKEKLSQQEKESSHIESNSTELTFEDRDDSSIYFSPDSGNYKNHLFTVISELDVRIEQFAQIYAEKLGIKENTLHKVLWGDYYLDPKTKRLLQHKHLKGRQLDPIFVQLVLKNIWSIYDSVIVNNNHEKIGKIVKSLNLKVLPRDMRSKDTRILLTSIFNQWLPLSKAHLPSPIAAQKVRLPKILYPNTSISAPPKNEIEHSLYKCDSNDSAPAIAFEEVIQSKEVFVGFARLYSGTIRVGQKLFVLGPKYDPAFPNRYCSEVIIKNLYLIMGRELESLKEVPAGNVFGVGNLEGHILKNGTLSSTKECQSLARVTLESAPIVRVALEPADPCLHLLNQADPTVQVLVQETGEHVILTAGEVHLERCLRDLKERFAKIEIHVSPPIVPFRETIVLTSDHNNHHGVVIIFTPNKHCTLRVRAMPLPPNVTTFLNQHSNTLKSFLNERQQYNKIENHEDDEDTIKDLSGKKSDHILDIEEFFSLLEAEFNKTDKEIWKNVIDRIWAFGPKRIGPNILINHIPNYTRRSWRQNLKESKIPGSTSSTSSEATKEHNLQELTLQNFDESINTGFQLATKAGPLCSEPLMGVAYFLEDFKVEIDGDNVDISELRQKLSGQIITTMRDVCRQSFLEWSPRLMLAMYSCDIQVTTEALGRVYAVISRRRGHIISEELKEGTPFFQIRALLPVVESFGLADEIRKRTSGAAIPQLIFSGFEMLNEDPFWVPTTEEELEDLGEKSDRENLAKKYMEGVRKRKGMSTDKKIVEHAEKQRTLKKK